MQKHFICPDNQKIEITECLKECRMSDRCLPLSALLAAGRYREWKGKFSVTQLLKPPRQTFLEITKPTSIKPTNQIASMIGTNFHGILENNVPNGWLSEVRLEDDICSGQFDAVDLINADLIDYKCFGAFRVARALGMYDKWEFAGVYKTGEKKGQNKYKKVWAKDGPRDVLKIAIQLSKYYYLLKNHGITCKSIHCWMFVKEGLNAVAKSYGLTEPAYRIPINLLPEYQVDRYLRHKKRVIEEAINTNVMPPVCKDRWNDKFCKEYCGVKEHCDYWIEKYSGCEDDGNSERD